MSEPSRNQPAHRGAEGDKPAKEKLKSYPLGYFHIDIAEVQTAEGELYLFLAIDRTSKFAFAQIHLKADKMIAAQFLRDLIAAVPYTIHTMLTGNGIQLITGPATSMPFIYL